MKKYLMTGLLAALFVPAFAQDCQEGKCEEARHNRKAGVMAQKDPQKLEQFKARREAAKAEMKARKEKMDAREAKLEKLVKEYKAAKDGSSKQTSKRKEIAAVLSEVQEEQAAYQAKQLEGFEKRLADMKAHHEKAQSTEAKAAWVEKMTDRVIEKDGDLGKVFKGAKGGKNFGPRKGGKNIRPVKGKHPMPAKPGPVEPKKEVK